MFARHTLVAFQCFDTLDEFEAITTLPPMPGQAALRGERKALPGPSSSKPSTSLSSCWSELLRIYQRHICTVSSLFSVNTSGRALGCFAGPLLCVPSLVEGKCGSSQDKPFFLTCSSADLPVVLSFLCCLPINDGSSVFCSTSRWPIRAQSRHRVLIFPVPCRVVSIWAPWSSMFDVFPLIRSSSELLVQHIS